MVLSGIAGCYVVLEGANKKGKTARLADRAVAAEVANRHVESSRTFVLDEAEAGGVTSKQPDGELDGVCRGRRLSGVGNEHLPLDAERRPAAVQPIEPVPHNLRKRTMGLGITQTKTAKQAH